MKENRKVCPMTLSSPHGATWCLEEKCAWWRTHINSKGMYGSCVFMSNAPFKHMDRVTTEVKNDRR